MCEKCFHSYVCEKYNDDRDRARTTCDYHNSHFVDRNEVVQVVRCQECKHWYDWEACGHPDNGWDAPHMSPEDFCSKGERR